MDPCSCPALMPSQPCKPISILDGEAQWMTSKPRMPSTTTPEPVIEKWVRSYTSLLMYIDHRTRPTSSRLSRGLVSTASTPIYVCLAMTLLLGRIRLTATGPRRKNVLLGQSRVAPMWFTLDCQGGVTSQNIGWQARGTNRG
jgi:hypothetical protein